MKRKDREPLPAEKAAREYARQFRAGRSFGTLADYAEADFLAGVMWAVKQVKAARESGN